MNKRLKSAANNKVCQVCDKEFVKKSNRDTHFNLFHVENNSIEIDDTDKSDLDNVLSTMVPVMPDDDNFVFLPNNEVDLTPNIEDSNNVNESEASNEYGVETENYSEPHIDDATDPVLSEPATQRAAKGSRLEKVVDKLAKTLDYSIASNQCVINKLRIDLKNNKKVAAEYMRSCFNEMMLEDEDFFNWLSAAVGFKPVRLINLLSENRPSNRISKLPLSDYQQIYDF